MKYSYFEKNMDKLDFWGEEIERVELARPNEYNKSVTIWKPLEQYEVGLTDKLKENETLNYLKVC